MREKLSRQELRAWMRLSVAAVVGSLTFGIILIAKGDWIPGGIVVAAGIAQIPFAWKLYHEGPNPSSRRGKTAS